MHEINLNVYVNIYLFFAICMHLLIKRGNSSIGRFSGWSTAGRFNEESFVIERWMLDIGRNNLIP